MVVHVLKQTASRFEANLHVRGTDFQWSNHYWFNKGGKNYYLIDTGTIISWALLSLLNKYLFGNLLTEIHVFVYLKELYEEVRIYEKKYIEQE